MPTLTRVDADRIVCRTITAERLFGASIAGICLVCLAFAVFILARGPVDSAKLQFFVPYVLGTVAGAWEGMILLGGLKNEWLVIDLGRRTYRGRRGLIFWAEAFRGPLDDLDHIRLVQAPADPREGSPGWALEFVWREDSHRPFRVTHWRPPRSFHLESCWGEADSGSLLGTLNLMSRYTGLPLEVPEAYLKGLALSDSEIDALGRS